MSEYDFKKILVSKGVISEFELLNLVKLYQDNEFKIVLHIINEGLAQRDHLGKLCGDSLGIAYTNLKKLTLQSDLVNLLPEELVKTFKIIPLYKFGKTITIATSDPKNLYILDKVEKILKCQVSTLFSFPDEIDEAISEHYSSKIPLQDPTDPEVINEPGDIEVKPHIFSESTKSNLINNSKEMINAVISGKIPKVSTTENIRNVIVEEVSGKVDLIFGFNQLRIHDEYTYSHSVNVAALTALMCKILGMDIKDIKEITLSALLHDIGKMRIPKVILYKPGNLGPEELELIKKHPQLGYQITQMMKLPDNISNLVLNHHERIDGNGYPRKLKGDAIPFSSQIIAIADIYDNLVSDKPNKKAMDHHEALNIMLLEGDQSFDFKLVRQFVSIAYKQNYESLKEKFKSSVYGQIT